MSHDESELSWPPQGPVPELSDAVSWDLVVARNFGCLGLSTGDRPDIFPINYVSHGAVIIFRTASGSRLQELTHNRYVTFEVDAETPDAVWSVVLKGTARVLDLDPELSDSELSRFPAWVPAHPFVYVSIVPDTIRGRLFEHRLRVGTGRAVPV